MGNGKVQGTLELQWINKGKSLLYEVDEDGIGIKPTWVEKDDIRVSEPRILRLRETYGDPDNDNILINGDNLLALRTLVEEFKGREEADKVKCIYIDPPYRTGAAFQNYDDNLEHSQWLTLMRDRLILLKTLLREDGVIFISLDDNEQAYCRVLMDEVFGRGNFIATLPTIMNLKGNQDQFGFAGTHEYTLVYSRNKEECVLYNFKIDEEEIESWEIDDYGYFKKGANLKSTGVNAPREKRPNLFFPIFISKDDFYVTEDDEPTNRNDIKLLPITDNGEMSWRWSKKKIQAEKHNLILEKSDRTIGIYKKQRPMIGELPSKKPKTLFYKPEYSSGNGTNQIKKIFGKKVFDNPKPLELIKDIIEISTSGNDLILDSFAGSGTTGEAVFRINEEEGTHRRFILIELMPKIADNITKVRLMKAIDDISKQQILRKRMGVGFHYFVVGDSVIGSSEMNWNLTSEELAEAVFLNFNFKRIAGELRKGVFVGRARKKSCFALCSVSRDIAIVKLEEMNKWLKELKDKYGEWQEVEIYTNKGVGVRNDSLPEGVILKKIPESILAKYGL